MLRAFWQNFSHPSIGTDRELSAYVRRVVLACVAAALCFDVINQLFFFEDWTRTLRSWGLTALIAAVIAAPVSRAIGKAHLDLFRAKLDAEIVGRTDPLTGLLNRRAIFESGQEGALEIMALVIVDIDRFKRVNDAHGHLAGDEVIRTVALRMVEELGDLGRICRMGGEEFALLASSVPPDALVARLWSFRDSMAATPILADRARVQVTISAGVAVRQAGQDFDALYRDADRALYMAKAAGRNRVVLASEVNLAEMGAVAGGSESEVNNPAEQAPWAPSARSR